jgi:hypothetical protein
MDPHSQRYHGQQIAYFKDMARNIRSLLHADDTRDFIDIRMT